MAHSFDGCAPPLVKLSVSATLLPVLCHQANPEDIFTDDIIITTPGHDYVGVEHMCPLQDNGKDIFLQPGELAVGNIFWSQSMQLMMEDAINKPRSMHIVMVTSRVYTTTNSTDLADNVHVDYAADKVVVMVLYRKGTK